MKRNKKTKNKRRYMLKIILLTVLVLMIVVIAYFIKTYYHSYEYTTKFNVSIYYNNFVKTNKETELYIKENEQYKKAGKVGSNIELSLNKITNTEDKYFNIKELDEKYYIYYEDVEKIEELSEVENRYTNYIPFNLNTITREVTNFYDAENKLVYSIDKSHSLPIVIKEDNMYGVEFNNRLLYIKKEECEVVENHNTDKVNSSGVGVLNYHFFYDDSNKAEKDACNEVLCISKTQFISELDFLEENNIMTIKSRELEMYIDGKIQLPKSVYITIDDGGRNEVALKILTERRQYATVFLITSWYDPANYYKSDYIELHSHGDNIHEQYRCNVGKQGGAIQCEDRKKLLSDLTLSREKLSGSTVFAYPFYEYNDYAISILKEAGFTMAFIGESSKRDNLVKVGMDKFKLPRFVMVNYTTKNSLSRYFGKIK